VHPWTSRSSGFKTRSRRRWRRSTPHRSAGGRNESGGALIQSTVSGQQHSANIRLIGHGSAFASPGSPAVVSARRAISPQHSLGRTRPRFSSSRLGPHFEDGLIRRGLNGPDLWGGGGGDKVGAVARSVWETSSNGQPTSFEGGNIAWLTVHYGHNLTQCPAAALRNRHLDARVIP